MCSFLRIMDKHHLRSRGSTKRSPSRPLGETSYPSVSLGNLLLCRTLILLCVAQALKVFWVLEQPKGSLMQHHPQFEEIMRMVDMYKHTISMKRFGAPSSKPTWLYCRILHNAWKVFCLNSPKSKCSQIVKCSHPSKSD